MVVVSRSKALVGAETDPGSAEGTDTQHKLLESSDTTTNCRVRQLGLVQRDNHAKNTDTAIM